MNFVQQNKNIFTKFIHFGCWNNGTCSKPNTTGLRETMDLLHDVITNEPEQLKTSLITIAGDNYYSKKVKNKEDGTKTKTITVTDLQEGFNCLNTAKTDIPTKIIMGNHEYETFSINENQVEEGCLIFNEQLRHNHTNNNEFIFFQEFLLNQDTLVIMFDSTIYEKDLKKNKDIKCYGDVLRNLLTPEDPDRYGLSDSFLALFDNIHMSNKNDSFDVGIQNEIIEIQRRFAENIVTKYTQNSNVKNIITIAHHPISYFKIKESATQNFTIDLSDSFFTFLFTLNQLHAPETPKQFYHLCADLHQYQIGEILIKNNTQNMKIKQYICGTGGADQDDAVNLNVADLSTEEYNIHYECVYSEKVNGFLEVYGTPTGLLFRFLTSTVNGTVGRKIIYENQSKHFDFMDIFGYTEFASQLMEPFYMNNVNRGGNKTKSKRKNRKSKKQLRKKRLTIKRRSRRTKN